MNPFLTRIQDQILNSPLSDEDKQAMLRSVSEADKQWKITDFKLDRTEKVKKTTAILLEETIEELEQKRRAVEAQSRESQIQLALERVRARTMAMQRSSELSDVATVLFQQVKALGVAQWACGFNIWEIGDTEFTFYPGSPDGEILPPCKVPLTEDPTFIGFDESRRRGDELFVYEKTGERQKEHYKYMHAHPGGLGNLLQGLLDAGLSFPEFQIDHLANFSHGNLLFITYEPCPEMHDIFRRFAKVFDQTYTRFLDLQKAEALAKEAVKQASLDRIRGQVASMRSADDLENIIPMLWHEFMLLGIPFIRCGVFIMNEEDAIINIYLSSADGKSLGLFHLPFHSGSITQNAVEHWRNHQVYQAHWNKEEFVSWMQTLVEAGQLKDFQTYQGSSAPPESLYLNFAPFKQGMLYVGSPEALDQDTIELIKTVANTFSIAYSRYEDFRLLEEAKDKIETTLVELKATQSQLVQSEKMASLGELTAGIAHEIQNPLNFVNNFSELSNELIGEMEEEMEKGNTEAVNSIIGNLRTNLEKINQHGKRADSIVKGMLQHSRTNTGEKESADINALADEYLRLAYHGFRAKEKNFNAQIKTDLDPLAGKIRIIPHDIGRVLLNIYNNAFFAVNERSGESNFEPTLTLSTKRNGNTMLITIRDNGKGIPEKIREKIFQPFFTTKPTGQGTGLGLSLSYDIVKSHGGELRVESREGEGSAFMISLPAE